MNRDTVVAHVWYERFRTTTAPFGAGSSSCNVAHFDANGWPLPCPDTEPPVTEQPDDTHDPEEDA